MNLSIEREKQAGTWNGKDYTKGFVLNEDKNTQEIKLEVYEYDLELNEPFIQRCNEIKTAYNKVHNEGKMVRRPTDATSAESKRCHACPMRDACWNIGQGRIKIGE